MYPSSALLFLSFTSLTLAAPTARELHGLFPRQSASLVVGSSAWVNSYPTELVTPTNIPQSWTDALQAAVNAGKIPNIVPATMTNGWPSYSSGADPASSAVCHYTLGCTTADDIINAPDGMIGVAQDDGPLPPGRTLVDFYSQKNISATHFYIGSNVLDNSDVMQHAMTVPGQHFAVHTWTHPYMSSLTNEQVVAELGWTMKIIADVNNGRVPSWWRPPYGDVDNRVRAIAKEVFGLKTVIWNYDTADWTLGSGASVSTITKNLQGFVDGPKSPGLIILEHELYDGCVTVFESVYPSMISNGWNLHNIPELWNDTWYKNAVDGTSALTDVGIIGNASQASSSAFQSSSSVISSSASSSSSTLSSSSALSSFSALSSSSSISASSTGASSSVVSKSSAALASATDASAASSSKATSSGTHLRVSSSFGIGALALGVAVLASTLA